MKKGNTFLISLTLPIRVQDPKKMRLLHRTHLCLWLRIKPTHRTIIHSHEVGGNTCDTAKTTSLYRNRSELELPALIVDVRWLQPFDGFPSALSLESSKCFIDTCVYIRK